MEYFARLSDYLLAVRSAADSSTRGVLVEVYIRIRDAMRERMVASGRVLDDSSDDPAALGSARPEDAAAQLRAMALRVCAAVRAREGGSGEVVHRVLQHIQHNFQESMSLKTLAERVGLRPVHLGQLIKEETGTLFTTYLNRLRIDRAKELLREAGRRPNEVARIVGYPDANYFYKVFRKQTGMTPTEFASRREEEDMPRCDRRQGDRQ